MTSFSITLTAVSALHACPATKTIQVSVANCIFTDLSEKETGRRPPVFYDSQGRVLVTGENSRGEIVLMNTLGQVVFRAMVRGSGTMPLPAVADGLYYLWFLDAEGHPKVQKILPGI